MDNIKLLKWDDNLSLGVDDIDKDHKRLFSIIGKILLLSQDEDSEKVKHATREGQKFFVRYAMEHFEREEAFMRSQNYSEYETHKAMHDDLKQNILPALKLSLEESDYAIDEIRHFLGVCAGWLSTHIMMVDQAIVHPERYQAFDMDFSTSQEHITASVQKVVQNLYALPSDLISEHYTGWDFGRTLFYEIIVQEEDGKIVHLLYLLEEKLVFTLAAMRIGFEIQKVDSYLLALLKNILSNMTLQMAYYLKIKGKPKQRSGQLIDSSEVQSIFANKTLNYSSLFSTKYGKFAFSVYEH